MTSPVHALVCVRVTLPALGALAVPTFASASVCTSFSPRGVVAVDLLHIELAHEVDGLRVIT